MMNESDALRARLRALQEESRSLTSRRRELTPNSPESRSDSNDVNDSLPISFHALEPRLHQLASLHSDVSRIRHENEELRAGLEHGRAKVAAEQQRHDQAMQQGLEQLRDLEVSLQSQRARNAKLVEELERAQERIQSLQQQQQQQEQNKGHLPSEKNGSGDRPSNETEREGTEENGNPSPTPAMILDKSGNPKEIAKDQTEEEPAPTTQLRAEVATPSAKKRDYRAETASEIRSNLDDTWLLRYADLYFEAKLGVGVSSTVYSGTYQSKRTVAIKVLKLQQTPKDLKDFKKELFIMSQVHSPHVVEFFGATLEPKLCVVMELCPNGTIFHALSRTPSPPPGCDLGWALALEWAWQIAEGMATLHSWEPQIVHRDLKPLNLLLDASWHVKICDFGLSRYTNADQASDEMQTLTKLRGTYAYTAPEIYHKAQYSPKSDVYSIGVIFWEIAARLVKGRYERPFAEFAETIKYDYQIIYQTATQQLRPTFPPNTPQKFKQIVQACWTQEPERRPTASQLLEGLDIARKDFEKFSTKWITG